MQKSPMIALLTHPHPDRGSWRGSRNFDRYFWTASLSKNKNLPGLQDMAGLW